MACNCNGHMNGRNCNCNGRTNGYQYGSGLIRQGSGRIDPSTGKLRLTVDDVNAEIRETGEKIKVGNNEYIVNSGAVRELGVGFLDNLNNIGLGNSTIPRGTGNYGNYQKGGKVRGRKNMASRRRKQRGGRPSTRRRRLQTGGHAHNINLPYDAGLHSHDFNPANHSHPVSSSHTSHAHSLRDHHHTYGGGQTSALIDGIPSAPGQWTDAPVDTFHSPIPDLNISTTENPNQYPQTTMEQGFPQGANLTTGTDGGTHGHGGQHWRGRQRGGKVRRVRGLQRGGIGHGTAANRKR